MSSIRIYFQSPSCPHWLPHSPPLLSWNLVSHACLDLWTSLDPSLLVALLFYHLVHAQGCSGELAQSIFASFLRWHLLSLLLLLFWQCVSSLLSPSESRLGEQPELFHAWGSFGDSGLPSEPQSDMLRESLGPEFRGTLMCRSADSNPSLLSIWGILCWGRPGQVASALVFRS